MSEKTAVNPAAIGALNAKLSPSVVTVTAGSGVTINDQFVYQMGKLVVVNVSATVGSSTLGSQADIITGLPAPVAAVPVVGCKNLGAGNAQAILNTNGKIVNNWDGFDAGKKYFFNFSYFTA